MATVASLPGYMVLRLPWDPLLSATLQHGGQVKEPFTMVGGG